MANAIKWEGAWTSRSTVLTTEMNSLANGSRTAAGTEIDNSTNLDQYCCLEIYLASLTPTSGGYLQVHLVSAPGGTNYSEGDGSTDPGNDRLVAVLPLRAATGTVRKVTGLIPIPPAKIKFLLTNNSGAALASSGNTVTMYTVNDEVQ